MSSFPSDIAPLLAKELPEYVELHQGLLKEWDPATGNNTVVVNGSILHNLTVLNISDVTALQAGDVVSILKGRSSYFIQGRVVVPGDPNYAATSVSFQHEFAEAKEFTLSTNPGTTPTLKTSALLTPPPWAGQALVTASLMVNYERPDPLASGGDVSTNILRAEIYIFGVGSGSTLAQMGTQFACVTTTMNRHLVEGVPEDSPIAVEAHVWCDQAPATDPYVSPFSRIYLAAAATYIR